MPLQYGMRRLLQIRAPGDSTEKPRRQKSTVTIKINRDENSWREEICSRTALARMARKFTGKEQRYSYSHIA
jgi:hypothetical protein